MLQFSCVLSAQGQWCGPNTKKNKKKRISIIKIIKLKTGWYKLLFYCTMSTNYYKKLCYGTGTARCTCQHRKAYNWWTTLTYTQGHHSCCYQMTVRHITTCLWTVVSTSSSRTLPLLKWTLCLPVTLRTLRTPSSSTMKLKLQATCNFKFMCKHIVVILHPIYEL